MFNLSTEYGNTLDLTDCVLNSLEIESPFISFYSQKQEYHVSYYLESKSLYASYTGKDDDMERLIEMYWGDNGIAEKTLTQALQYQRPLTLDDTLYRTTEQEEIFKKAAAVILHVMDDFSILAEKLIG